MKLVTCGGPVRRPLPGHDTRESWDLESTHVALLKEEKDDVVQWHVGYDLYF
jgi:hypothetical protein